MTQPAAPSGTRYEPIAQIGRGGMAEVQLAMAHTGGGVRRLVVLKRIWPELAHDPDFVSMFLDEARLALRLSHANVVQTYEVLTGGEGAEMQLAIAMEYLDGQPLTKILNRLMRGPSELSLALRLRIAISVLAGLEHAHTLTDLDGTPLGVVHRDVSPQNVFVTYDGQVKLVDFGVAKTEAASHVTRPGTLKGKLAYTAPEQLQPGTIDRRADVFAVGVMLWEMLACRRMWHGMTEVDIVGYLASGQPMPALPADANLPAGLDAICARALETDPERRYQTAADLEIDLERVLVGAADSHARHLGKVIAMAFAAERAERQALIERHARATDAAAATTAGHATAASPAATMTSSGSIDIPLGGMEVGGASKAALAIEVSISDAAMLGDAGAPSATNASAPNLGAANIAVASASLTTSSSASRFPSFGPMPTLARRTPWYRRVSTLGVATAAVLLAAGVSRRPASTDDQRSPVRAAIAPEEDPNAKQAGAARLAPAAPKPGHHASRASSSSSAEDVSRARRHRRPVVLEDDDATLPPTWDNREP